MPKFFRDSLAMTNRKCGRCCTIYVRVVWCSLRDRGLKPFFGQLRRKNSGHCSIFKGGEGLDELIWALVYRLGPVRIEDIAKDTGFSREHFDAAMTRLVEVGRVEELEKEGEKLYRSTELVIPRGATIGWEAAVFDHYKAMVNTITARVAGKAATFPDSTGGCTYTLEVWEGHPLKEEVYGALSRLRTQLSELRNRVEKYNGEHEVPEEHVRVLLYAGQCLISEGNLEPTDEDDV